MALTVVVEPPSSTSPPSRTRPSAGPNRPRGPRWARWVRWALRLGPARAAGGKTDWKSYFIVAMVAIVLAGTGTTVVAAAKQAAAPATVVAQNCTATPATGTVAGFTGEQLTNAASIIATTRSMGAPPRAALVALATAMQESTLRNLTYGDRDSLGLFQ